MSDVLEHHGVKGMKWGVRKRRDDGGGSGGRSSKSKKPPKEKAPSRRERRKAKSAERQRADIKKAEAYLDKALKKGDDVLINLNGQVVVTGKEFVSHLANGGYLNVRTTSVFAEVPDED